MFVLLSLVASCVAISEMDANNAVEAIKQHQSQSSPAPLYALNKLVADSYDKPEDRQQLEQAMIVLLKSDATVYGKHCICKQLVKIGSAASVPVLADLLLDPSVGESACYALRSNTSDQATEALKAALSKAQQPILSQIILVIANRKDLAAVDDLIKLLNSEDEAVVRASMNALGYMADRRAGSALEKMTSGKYSDAATDELLHYAQTMVQANQRAVAVKLYRKYFKSKESFLTRRTALLGLMQYGDKEGLKLALSILKGKDETFKSVVIGNIHYLFTDRATTRLVDQLGNLNAKQQAELMDMLVKLKGADMLGLIKRMASNKSIEIRLAALKALGRIGNVSSVSILIGALDGTPDEKALANTSLLQIKAQGANDELIRQLPGQNEATRIELIKVLTDRDSLEAVDVFFDQAKSGSPKLAVAAYRAIRTLGESKHLPELIDRLQLCKNDKVRTAIIKSLTSIARRSHSEESLSGQIENVLSMPQTIDTRKSLLKAAGKLYDERSFVILKKALQDDAVKGIAFRQLAQWPGVEALPVLKSVYKTDPDRTSRIVALRAVVRLLKSQNQLTMADTVREYKDVLAASKRSEDKKELLSGLAKLRTPLALDLVAPLLDEKGVRTEAQLAAVHVAAVTGIEYPAKARAVLSKVLAAPVNEELKNKAQATIDKISEFESLTIDTLAKPLFDGKTFTGFEGDLNWFRIEDGAIVAGKLTKDIPHNFFLATTKEYFNFELRLKAKTSAPDVNGGIQFRSKRIPNHHKVSGYQADIAGGIWGALYDESRRSRFLVPPHAEVQKTIKDNDWNDYKIRCVNDRVQLFVNGVKTVDYVETDPAIAKQQGIIAVQIHGGPPAEARYKDIKIKDLGTPSES